MIQQLVSNTIHQISRKRTNRLTILFRRITSFILCNRIFGVIISAIYQDKIPNGDCIIKTDCDTVKPSTKARLFWGVYETPEIDFVKKYLRSDTDVIELGSSIGVVASHVGKKLELSKRLICVEANPLLINCLQTNIETNVNTKNTFLIHGAIDYSSEKEWVEFSISNSSLESKVGHVSGALNFSRVPVTTLSKILSEYNIDDYTLICDVEGAEKALLEYEKESLKRCKQLHIEMKDTVLEDTIVKIDEIVNILINQLGFHMIDSYLGAYVFERVN